MKTVIRKLLTAKGLLLMLLTVMLSSYSTVPGTDSFKIYVNNKLTIQQNLHERKDLSRLMLNPESDEQLSVEYNQCGKINTARKLILKNGENKIVKKWDFADSPDLKNPMTIKVSELSTLIEKTQNLNLYYASNELSDGQILASLHLTRETARRE